MSSLELKLILILITFLFLFFGSRPVINDTSTLENDNQFGHGSMEDEYSRLTSGNAFVRVTSVAAAISSSLMLLLHFFNCNVTKSEAPFDRVHMMLLLLLMEVVLSLYV